MNDDPDSGYPSARDGLHTSTPLRPGATPHIKELMNASEMPSMILEEPIEHGEHSPEKKSRPSRTSVDVTIRRTLEAERKVIANNRLNRSLESQNDTNTSRSMIQDLRFSFDGELKECKKSLQESINESIKVLEKTAILEQENSALKESLRKRDEDCLTINQQATSKNEKLEKDLKTEKEHSKVIEKQLQEVKNELSNQIIQLQAIKQENITSQSLNVQNESLSNQLKNAQADLSYYKNYAEEQKEIQESLREEVNSINKKLKTSENSELDLLRDNAMLRASLDKISQQEQELKVENEKTKEEIHDLKEREDNQKRKIEKLQAEFDEEQKKNKLLVLEIQMRTKMANEVEDLRRQLSTSEEERNSFSNEINDLKNSLISKTKKLTELEEASKILSEKEVESSNKYNCLYKEHTDKIKEHTKTVEELASIKEKLQKANEKYKELKVRNNQNAEAEEELIELKQINEKFSQEIGYLRNENKEKEGIRQNFLQLQNDIHIISDELHKKTIELDELKEKYTKLSDVSIKQKDIQIELDKRIESTKEQEFTIATLKRSIEDLQRKYNEKEDRHEVILEEYSRFKETKINEIQNLVAKCEEVSSSYAELHLRFQEMHYQQQTLARCSSVWENLPEALKAKLPNEVEEFLKSLKIGRDDALSVADSQQSNHSEEYKNMAESVERYYAENMNPTDMKYNIFQLLAKFIRDYNHQNNDSAVEFSHSLGQLLERIEKRYQDMKTGLEKIADEERKSKREFHKKYQEAEIDIDNERLARTRAENLITDLRSQISVLGSKTTADEKSRQILILREELQRLKENETKQKEVTEQCLKLVSKEYETELDIKHNEEMRLHERIRIAEADAEKVKRKLEATETTLHEMSLENDRLKHGFHEKENTLSHTICKLEKCQEKLKYEDKAKRYNQETIKQCLEHIEFQLEFIEHLKRRNYQRQKVIEKIYKDLTNISSQEKFKDIAAENLNFVEQYQQKWNQEEHKQNLSIEERQNNFNKVLRERSTPELRVAFQEARKGTNKENIESPK